MNDPDAEDAPRFEERDTLGGGAGGRVVRGHDRHLERHVALKIVAAHDRVAIRRLRREAAILVALEHPGIVPLYDLVERDDGGLQLALRIVRGASLESVMARSPRPELTVQLRHLARAAEAVAWAHHEGFVHRDLKPANIMIGDFGETQVIDWGLAARLDGDDLGLDADGASGLGDPFDAGLTHIGAVLGTPRYMCPEQARGERVDARADVWGLGAILFEIVAGRPAFPERDVARLLDERRGGALPDLAQVSRAPVELIAIIRRALAPEPEDRYPDARAFADDLNAWLDGRPVAAHRYRWRHRLARFVSRRRAALALAVGGLAAVGAFALAPEPEVIEDTPRAVALESDLAGERRRLANLSLDEAEASLHRRELPEARAAAVRALALAADDPTADTARGRGIIALIEGAQHLRLEAEIALGAGDCLARTLHPDRRRWLCRRAGAVALFEGATERWRYKGVFDGAVFVGSRVALLDATRVVTVLSIDGALAARLPTGAGDAIAIHPGEDAELALVHGRGSFILFDGERLYQSHRARFHQAAAVARGHRWAILHSDGWLGHGRLDPAAPATPLAIGASHGLTAEAPTDLEGLVRQVSALVLRDDEVVLGTLHGELLRVGLDGHTRARVVLREDGVTTLRGAIDGGLIAQLRLKRAP